MSQSERANGKLTAEPDASRKIAVLETSPEADPDGTRMKQAEKRIEQAETRTQEAEGRTERAKTRTERAEMRIEEAEVRTEQAKTRTERAEMRTGEAEVRTEQAKTQTEQANARTEKAENREEQLRASERSYRRLFEASRDGILILDVDSGRITDANPFMVELLGFSPDEMVGKTVGELSPFDDIESNKIMLGRLQKDGYIRYEDLPLQKKNGGHVAVEFVSNLYHVGDQRVIQCNVRDITARKQLEMASIWLASIIEHSGDAIVGKDLNGIITSWNKAAEKIFGYTASEITGTSIIRLIPADRHFEEDEILGRIKRGESIEHFETVRQTKDRRLIDVSVTISPIKEPSGKVIGVSKVARDISERKRGEEKMCAMQAELEKTNRDLVKRSEEIQYFYHTLSHELKTPLTSAREFISILIDGLAGEVNPTQLSYLRMAKESCTDLAVYINDLLDATRLDTGKMRIELKPVSLAFIIQRAIAIMEPVAAGKNIRVREVVDAQLTDVMADKSRIMQILTNLLNNALKFTSEGGEVIVKLGKDPKTSDYVQISVTDTGCGIPEDQIEHLFHRFFQIRNGDTTPKTGVGLGLYLCREMVSLHGGNIWVESTLGKGSTFSFTLPKHGPVAGHVLVIDDDRELNKALCYLLEGNGFDVATVAGGREALESIGQKSPDVVVLDLKMAGLDGPSTLQEIRKNFGLIPVIVHTGHPESDLMQRALEFSPFTLLEKPCPHQKFLETVRQVCRDAEPAAKQKTMLAVNANA